MALDLATVYGDLDSIGSQARDQAVEGGEFPSEFTVPRVDFHDESGALPLRLALMPRFSDNPLPIPAEAEVTPEGELEVPDSVQVRRTDVTVRKIESASPVSPFLTIATGTLENGSGPREFVALGEPGPREFRLSLRGMYSSDHGAMYTVSIAADGSILPEEFSDGRFRADCKGSLFRLDGGPGGMVMSEAEFGTLERIEFTRSAEIERAVLEGSLRLAGEEIEARVELTHGPARSVLSVVDTASNERRLLGVAPAERVDFRVLGGLDAVPPTAGAVVVYDRESWDELHRFEVDGVLAGLGWDGTHLWQARWPSGDFVRIDPASAGGDMTVMPGPPEGKVAGVAFDGSAGVLGVCSSDVARGDGDTYIADYDPPSGSLEGRVPRQHSMSSGMAIGPEGLIGSLNGGDQTPVSSASGLLRIDRETGNIMGMVILPRYFFVDDVDQTCAGSALVTVTEGLSGFGRPGGVYELALSPER